MTAESLPMVERLGLKPDDPFAPPTPCLSWSGQSSQTSGLHVQIVQNGQ